MQKYYYSNYQFTYADAYVNSCGKFLSLKIENKTIFKDRNRKIKRSLKIEKIDNRYIDKSRENHENDL